METRRGQQRSPLQRAVLGFLPPLVALALHGFLASWLTTRVYLLYYPAVFFSSWLGGLHGGLVATALSSLLILYWFVPPIGSFAVDSPGGLFQIGVFAGMGVVFSVFHERLQKVTARLEALLEQRTGELEATRESGQEALSHLSAIIESSMDAVVSVDAKGRVILFNPAAVQMFGCPESEAVGRTVEHFVPEEFRQRLRVALAGFAASEGRARPLGAASSLRALRADGSAFPVEATVSKAVVAGENIFTLALRDISGRMQAEEKVRESLARYREALDTMMEGAEIFDFDWRYLYVNAAMCAHSRRPAEELLGRLVTEVFPGFEHTGFYRAVNRCMLERIPVEFEDEFAFPDGSTGYFQLQARPVPEGALVLTMDVTEQRRAAERLREQASLLDKAQDAILVRDLGNYITYWNKGAERMYGWTAEEAVGLRISDLLYRDTEAFHAATSRAVEEGEWHGELEQVTKAGRTIRVDARWTLVRGPDGRPQSILAINTDITERKALEQQYLRAQRMESIGTLAGGIAHDLNNVLAPILLSVDVLSVVSKDPKVKSTLAILENSAKHGADLVKQILSFARGSEGDRTLIDVRHVVRDVVQMLEETFPPGISLAMDLPPELPSVRGDATQVRQVLMNLGVNARDAMEAGGRLTISASVLDLDDEEATHHVGARPGRHVVLEVADTGNGISPEDQTRIFDPFYTTKAPGKGTGLGLATVASIVRSHGGFLTLDSAPGRGTTFRIAFPAEQELSDLPLSGPGNDLPRGHGEAVLVIDDEESVRRMTMETLEVFGFQAIEAADGEEGIRLYGQHRDRIRVVLCDMRMPGLDGRATIEGLRRIDPAVCVIAISGMTDGVGEGESGGVPDVFEFLAKPYSVRVLLETLRRALRATA